MKIFQSSNSRTLAVVITTVSIIASLAPLAGCKQSPQYGYITGETMGTSYHIRYKKSDSLDSDKVQQTIYERLTDINNSMSTYQANSTISKFNTLPSGQPLTIDEDFINVYNNAKKVYDLSGGAFDPTVMPLINLWGFGSVMTVDRLQNPPSDTDIAEIKQLIGFDKVKLSGENLTKTQDKVAVDFSAIAKGYAVDVIAAVLYDEYKITHYMVEIGGEVATSGANQHMQPWKIAIDAPIIDSSVRQRQTIAAIRQPNTPNKLHLATSGNYRNSVVFDGKRYSHTIDPTTGQPIVGGAPSVSVAAESVSLADAWATALTAMTYEKALKTATDNNLAALFVIPKGDDIQDNMTKTAPKTAENAPNLSHSNKNNSVDGTLEHWQVIETPAMKSLRSGNSI